MAKCLNCETKYFVWDGDSGTIFEKFCSLECASEYKSKQLDDEDKNWPSKPAMKYKAPVGEIACPHCGTVQHGTLHPFCAWCDKPYWTESEFKNNPYFYD